MHSFVKKTLEDLIYKISHYTDYLLLRPSETVEAKYPATFIDFRSNEIKELRLELRDMQYDFEKLDKNCSEEEKKLFEETHNRIKELYDFLFHEGISRPKTFFVYNSYREEKYLEMLRNLRFEVQHMQRKIHK